MKKYLIVFMTAVILLTQSMSVFSSATNPWISTTGDSAQTYDIPLSQSKAIDILSGLGIIDDAIYYKEICMEPITRLDAAVILYNFSGRKDGGVFSGNSSEKFDDLNSINEAIEYVVGENIMDGTSLSTFSPDENVSYEMLCKMIACFMGYRTYAESMGGYPVGYTKTVSSKKLIDAQISDHSAVTNGEFILALYKLFDKCRMVESISELGTYETEEENVLYKNLGISGATGIVRAGGGLTLGEAYSATAGINIDGEEYLCDNFTEQERYNMRELVGKQVEYYFNDNDEQLLYCYTDESLSKTTVIYAYDIDRISGNLIYTEEKNYRVTGNAGVIKNNVYTGKSFEMLADNTLIPNTGYIMLIDNDADNTIEYVKVYDYVNAIAGGVNTRTRTITDKISGKDITYDDSGAFSQISQGGTLVSAETLSDWSALGLLYSENGELMGIEVSTYTPVSGTVTRIDDGKCIIGENEYVISDMGIDSSNPLSTANITIGTKAQFILNVVGEIVAINTSGMISGKMTAYLVSAVYDFDMDNARIKVFTEDGEMVWLNLAEKIRINNVDGYTGQSAYSYIAPDKKVSQQIVTIDVNSSEEVREIGLTYDPYKVGSVKYDDCISLDSYFARRTWRKTHSKFEYAGTDADPSEREFYTTSSTKVFGVPQQYNGSEDDSKFSVTDISVFTDSANYIVSGYNLDDEYNAAIVVAQLSNTAYIDNNETPLGIITNVGTAVNELGDIATSITLYFNGSKDKYIISDTAEIIMYQPYSTSAYIPFTADKLKKGDAVRVAFNQNGEIGALVKCLPDTPDGTLSPNLTTFCIGRGAYNECTYGKAVKKSGSTFVLQALQSNVNVNLVFRATASTNIYVYDIEKDEIYKGSLSDVYPEDRTSNPSYVIVKAKDNALEDMIVYNY